MRYLLYSFSTDVYRYMASNVGTSSDKPHPCMSWAGLVNCHLLFSVLLPLVIAICFADRYFVLLILWHYLLHAIGFLILHVSPSLFLGEEVPYNLHWIF